MGKSNCYFCRQVNGFRFSEARKAGIFFGKDDLIIPENKKELLEQTSKQVKNYERQYSEGLPTKGEKYNKAVDAWAKMYR